MNTRLFLSGSYLVWISLEETVYDSHQYLCTLVRNVFKSLLSQCKIKFLGDSWVVFSLDKG